MGEGWMKENGGGGEFKYDIFDILWTFTSVTMYPHQHNTKTFLKWGDYPGLTKWGRK
jgi:hypothetical protein